MRPVAEEKDPGKQSEVFHKINEEIIQPHAKKIEQLLIQNGTTGFLIGNAVRQKFSTDILWTLTKSLNQFPQVTWADIAYYACFTNPLMVFLGAHHVLDSHPLLKKLIQHVGDIPSIKKWKRDRLLHDKSIRTHCVSFSRSSRLMMMGLVKSFCNAIRYFIWPMLQYTKAIII